MSLLLTAFQAPPLSPGGPTLTDKELRTSVRNHFWAGISHKFLEDSPRGESSLTNFLKSTLPSLIRLALETLAIRTLK